MSCPESYCNYSGTCFFDSATGLNSCKCDILFTGRFCESFDLFALGTFPSWYYVVWILILLLIAAVLVLCCWLCYCLCRSRAVEENAQNNSIYSRMRNGISTAFNNQTTSRNQNQSISMGHSFDLEGDTELDI